MQIKFSLEICEDSCSLVFREKPSNIILFVDGAEKDFSTAYNCNWNISYDFCFEPIDFFSFSQLTVKINRAQKVKIMPRNMGVCPFPRDIIDEHNQS